MNKRTAAICLIALGAALLIVDAICASSMAHLNAYGASLIATHRVRQPEWLVPMACVFFCLGGVYLYAEEIGSRWNRGLKWSFFILTAMTLAVGIALYWNAHLRVAPAFDPSKPYVELPQPHPLTDADFAPADIIQPNGKPNR